MSKAKSTVVSPRDTSYTVGEKGSRLATKGVFRTLPLPRGRKIKILDREVFEGAVRAAMKARKSA